MKPPCNHEQVNIARSANDLGAAMVYTNSPPTELYRSRLKLGLARLQKIANLPMPSEEKKTLVLTGV